MTRRPFWRCEEVAGFLGCSPELPHGDSDLGAVFRFPVGDAVARLTISPAGRSVLLELGDTQAPLVNAGMVECRMVYLDDDDADEGGQCLVLSGPGSHVAISKAAHGFSIFFGLHGEEGALPDL